MTCGRCCWADVVTDPRERANLRHKQPELFEHRRARWAELDREFLPLTDDVYTHGLSPDIQADRYVPDRRTRDRL